MSLLDNFRKIFPKPTLQKRYWLGGVVCLIIYMGLEAYVAWTPTKDDDNWPDQFRDGVLYYLVDNDGQQRLVPVNEN